MGFEAAASEELAAAAELLFAPGVREAAMRDMVSFMSLFRIAEGLTHAESLRGHDLN